MGRKNAERPRAERNHAQINSYCLLRFPRPFAALVVESRHSQDVRLIKPSSNLETPLFRSPFSSIVAVLLRFSGLVGLVTSPFDLPPLCRCLLARFLLLPSTLRGGIPDLLALSCWCFHLRLLDRTRTSTFSFTAFRCPGRPLRSNGLVSNDLTEVRPLIALFPLRPLP